MSKPRLLYLCPRAPWPRNGGALLRNDGLIRGLSRRYAIDLVVADEPGSAMPGEFAARIDSYAAFPRPPARRSTARRAVGSLVPGRSMMTSGWTDAALREHVADLVGRRSYDAIHVDLPMIDALPRRDAVPIIYNAHNCETLLLRRRAATEAPHIGAYLALEAIRVARQERAMLRRAALVAACSDTDRRDLLRLDPTAAARIVVVPNGIDVAAYAAARRTPPPAHVIALTGSLDWRPNIVALRWFLATVLPTLRRNVPDVVIRVAGRMSPALERRLRAIPNVDVCANPASMVEILARSTIVAAPIVASSGTRLRILEAWAAQRPVVTTRAGAFGLDVTSGHEVLLADEPRTFAGALASLAQNDDLCRRLARHGLRRAAEFDWTAVGDRAIAAYEPIVSGAGRGELHAAAYEPAHVISSV